MDRLSCLCLLLLIPPAVCSNATVSNSTDSVPQLDKLDNFKGPEFRIETIPPPLEADEVSESQFQAANVSISNSNSSSVSATVNQLSANVSAPERILIPDASILPANTSVFVAFPNIVMHHREATSHPREGHHVVEEVYEKDGTGEDHEDDDEDESEYHEPEDTEEDHKKGSESEIDEEENPEHYEEDHEHDDDEHDVVGEKGESDDNYDKEKLDLVEREKIGLHHRSKGAKGGAEQREKMRQIHRSEDRTKGKGIHVETERGKSIETIDGKGKKKKKKNRYETDLWEKEIGKAGNDWFKDKWLKKKGWKNVFHKEEWGDDRKFKDIFRDKDWKKKWTHWDKNKKKGKLLKAKKVKHKEKDDRKKNHKAVKKYQKKKGKHKSYSHLKKDNRKKEVKGDKTEKKKEKKTKSPKGDHDDADEMESEDKYLSEESEIIQSPYHSESPAQDERHVTGSMSHSRNFEYDTFESDNKDQTEDGVSAPQRPRVRRKWIEKIVRQGTSDPDYDE